MFVIVFQIVWPADWVAGNPQLPYFLLTVDGTHCSYHEIKHPTLPFDPTMKSHKTNEQALGYEVALSVNESKVVETNVSQSTREAARARTIRSNRILLLECS